MGALVLALCLLGLLGVATPTQADVEGNKFVPRQAVVKLGLTSIVEINRDYGTTTIEKLAGSEQPGASRGIYLLRLPTDSTTLEMVAHLAADPRLLFAEPNFVAEAPEDPEGVARMRARGISSTKPSSTQYAATNLKLSCAHTISRGLGTKVAVVDTGAQLNHPALDENFGGTERRDFVDGDSNPWDRPLGRDKDGDGEKDEMVGHGTHVAGIVDLVAPKAKIMPLRALNTEGYGDVFRIAKAISYAKRNEADVINLSLGTSSYSRLLKDVIEDATRNGVVVAAAAGNSNTESKHYPAARAKTDVASSADGLVAVTSVNRDKIKSGFANYGTWVDISAPGNGIRSAFPISVYANWSGTSMATPFISGQAALIHEEYPDLNPAGIEGRIRDIDFLARKEFYDKNPEYKLLLPGTGMLGAGHADVCASLQ
jgi:thermitase